MSGPSRFAWVVVPCVGFPPKAYITGPSTVKYSNCSRRLSENSGRFEGVPCRGRLGFFKRATRACLVFGVSGCMRIHPASQPAIHPVRQLASYHLPCVGFEGLRVVGY